MWKTARRSRPPRETSTFWSTTRASRCSGRRPTAEVEVDRFDALFAANVRAPFFLVAALAPIMAARGRGSIVNVGSMVGQIGVSGTAAYGATKAAMSSMTRAWAAEFSPSDVRVNAVAPGPVYTDGSRPSARRHWATPRC